MNEQTVRVLVVEDEASHTELIQRAFGPRAAAAGRFHLTIAGSLKEARACLAKFQPDLVIADLLLPDGRGIELLPAREERPPFPMILMTSYGSEQVAVEATKAGALDYVVKSVAALTDMPHIAERALREWGHIVERWRAEEALNRRAAQLALINDIGRRIAAALDPDEVLERATRLVQASFGYHRVALFTVDREQGELVMRARAGDFAHRFPPDHRIMLDQGVVGWVGGHSERLLANDVSAEPRYINFFPDVIPTRSELCVPIRVSQETVGVLDVQSPQVNAFDENDVTVMETLADQIAVAIENARLYAAIQ